MLDLIVCICIVVGILVGSKIGFIREAYGIISSLLALVLAFLIYTPIKAILALTPIQSSIYTWNIEKLSALPVVQGVQSQAKAIQEATAWLPQFVGEELIKNNNSEVYALLGANNLAEYISAYITDLCLGVLAIIIVWIVVKLILSISVGALDLIAKLPVIRTANKLLGSVLGGVKVIVSLWIVGLALPVLVMIPQLSQLQVALDQSLVARWLYENNIILHYMSNILIK